MYLLTMKTWVGLGVDTSFVIFACLVSELLEIVIFLVTAATNLHMNRNLIIRGIMKHLITSKSLKSIV